VGAPVDVRPTIDRSWLEAAAAREPLTHAYALWDLERTPGAIRFVSALRGEATVAYLLAWMGRRDRPVVHVYGEPEALAALWPSLPGPPFVAVVPVEVEPALRAAFEVPRRDGLRLMLRVPGPLPRGTGAVRRLRRTDTPALAELARGEPAPELAAYPGLDLEAEPVWGAFEDGRLVGVARAAVRLPAVWVVGGVYVVPDRRGRGLGREVVGAVARAAEATGARAGLYARDEPSPALRLYEALGFHEVGRRAWLEIVRPASGH
jgi:ribosomal protein S18 acetylase RimI-like enzyme